LGKTRREGRMWKGGEERKKGQIEEDDAWKDRR
jgi:hypothetical protein